VLNVLPTACCRRVETDLNFPALSCDHAFAAKLMYEVSAQWQLLVWHWTVVRWQLQPWSGDPG